MPAERVERRCPECLRGRHERLLAKPNRCCRWCPASIDGRDFYCGECRREIGECQREKLKLRLKPCCSRCGVDLVRGATARRCAKCEKAARLSVRRRCAECRRILKPVEGGVCKKCLKDLRTIDAVRRQDAQRRGPFGVC